MVKAKKFTLAKHFEGEPKQGNFKLVDEDLAELKEDGNTSKKLIYSVYIISNFFFFRNFDRSAVFIGL